MLRPGAEATMKADRPVMSVAGCVWAVAGNVAGLPVKFDQATGGDTATTAAAKSVICAAGWVCGEAGKSVGLPVIDPQEVAARRRMACAVRSGVIHVTLSVPASACAWVALPSGMAIGVASLPMMTEFWISTGSVAVRRASPVAVHLTSRRALTTEGAVANAASRGIVLRSRMVWPGDARARKFAAANEDLRATVVAVPAAGETATPFSTKTTSRGTESRRLRTSVWRATLLAALLTNRLALMSRYSFMPLKERRAVKSGGSPSHSCKDSEVLDRLYLAQIILKIARS